MKTCPYCGKQYPDDAVVCAIDGEALSRSAVDRKSIAGVWRGVYGYVAPGPLAKMKPVPFTLKLEQGWLGHFTGKVTEDAPEGIPGTGVIDGHFKSPTVEFTKQMPVGYVVRTDGSKITLREHILTQGGKCERELPSASIEYEGTFLDANRVQGTWVIKPQQIPISGGQSITIAETSGIWCAEFITADIKASPNGGPTEPYFDKSLLPEPEIEPEVEVQADPAPAVPERNDTTSSKQDYVPMNGYLFIAGVTQSQVLPSRSRGCQMVDTLQTWDGCASAIIYGGDPEQSQRRFEAWCQPVQEGEHQAAVIIKRIVAAQFVDQLFTEAGDQPLYWPKISEQVNDLLQATSVDDFEQGYWVDINQAVPPGKISPDIESLKRELPEEIRSGLNWSPDRKFYFLVSVLSPRPLPVLPADRLEADTTNPDAEKPDLDGFVATLPEMRDKEAAGLVEARNSVVAAWLWRKYAVDTRLAVNEIKIDPCCSFIPVE